MPDTQPRHLIVIGASAGGVEAFTYIAQHLPTGLPAAIVFVLHLGADSPNMLPWLVARRTKIPVVSPKDGEPLRPGHIYAAVPDRHLTFENGTIRITMGPKENRHRPGIDTTFRSAARCFGSRVIGVVLTGNLDDGSNGLALIKKNGGIAIVQAPADAAFPSMPRHAIGADHPDFVVPLSEIPELLKQLLSSEKPQKQTIETVQNAMTPSEEPTMPNESSGYEPEGAPSVYTCPECSGTLFEKPAGNGEGAFECRVGHRYTLPALMNDNYDAVERALWIAMRNLEESASLSGRMADNARKRGQSRIAERFEEQARERQLQVDSIRQVIFRSQPVPETKPENAA